MQVRLCDEDMESLRKEIFNARGKPVERPGLYIMVFICLINSCSTLHQVRRAAAAPTVACETSEGEVKE